VYHTRHGRTRTKLFSTYTLYTTRTGTALAGPLEVVLNLVAYKFSTVFLAAAKSRMLELLAFDEYYRFDTSACASAIKRGSLYRTRASRSIKTAVFIES
jgi:hypothetical protein